MADRYCSAMFKTGEDLDLALTAALRSGDDANRAEAAAIRAEEATEECIKYIAQELDAEQKAVARANIGAVSVEELNAALGAYPAALSELDSVIGGVGE